eukprot:TRINITY_DN63090_c0_g1_i1.p1 TRINITY_DN63090_c0_g1~~TRINITY_DN63090_c0_g1_i1.p1  ORF type:complete len:644 (+),score=46.49 TRINITY_DN63090_c0_g1_i1:7-1938(+)
MANIWRVLPVCLLCAFILTLNWIYTSETKSVPNVTIVTVHATHNTNVLQSTPKSVNLSAVRDFLQEEDDPVRPAGSASNQQFYQGQPGGFSQEQLQAALTDQLRTLPGGLELEKMLKQDPTVLQVLMDPTASLTPAQQKLKNQLSSVKIAAYEKKVKTFGEKNTGEKKKFGVWMSQHRKRNYLYNEQLSENWCYVPAMNMMGLNFFVAYAVNRWFPSTPVLVAPSRNGDMHKVTGQCLSKNKRVDTVVVFDPLEMKVRKRCVPGDLRKLVCQIPNVLAWANKYTFGARVYRFHENTLINGTEQCIATLPPSPVVPNSIFFPHDCRNDKWKKKVEGSPDNQWITKSPSQHVTQGIEIIPSFRAWYEKNDPCTSYNLADLHSRIILQSIVDPYLIHGKYKVALTAYVPVTHMNGRWAVFWGNPFAQRTFVEYVKPGTTPDRDTLLTNFEQQGKINSNPHEWIVVFSALCQEIANSSRWSQQFGDPDAVAEHLIEQISNAVRLGFRSVEESINRVCGGFHFMRYDFVLGADLSVQILELNPYPGMEEAVYDMRELKRKESRSRFFANFRDPKTAFPLPASNRDLNVDRHMLDMITSAVDLAVRIQKNPTWRPAIPLNIPLHQTLDDSKTWFIAFDEATDPCARKEW